MNIRLAAYADRAAVVRMAMQFIATSGYRGLIEPKPDHLEAFACYLMDEGAIFIAEQDVEGSGSGGGEVFGMLAAQVFPHPMSGELTGSEVAWWLDPAQRGGSAAMRLLGAAETWARGKGAQRFQMIAPVGTSLGDIYRRRGYLEVETVYQRPLVD